MNGNFGKNIAEMTEQELLTVVNNYTMESAQVAMGELNRRAAKELKESMDKLDKSTGIYSKVIALLTAFLVFIAIEQTFITIFPPRGILIFVYILSDIAFIAVSFWIINKTLDI